MKILIVGLGISGKAVAHYLLERGDCVKGVDRILQEVEGVEVFKESDPIALEGYDCIIKSPGISFSHPWILAARAQNIPVIGEIDLALQELKHSGKTLFAITGTNGKTSTTLFTTHLLKTTGKNAIAVGNVGTPLISQVKSGADIFVIELSSFQLEQMIETPIFDAAVILNITPNHLDRYPSFEAYAAAKWRLESCLKPQAPLYVGKQVASHYGKGEILDSHKEKVETILSLSYRDGKIHLYPHELENIAAAYALVPTTEVLLKEAVATFKRPPHRLEVVGEIDGVTYINDSKATSVDAVIKAVEAIETPIVLIAGGLDKGGSYCTWIPLFRKKVKRVLAMGEAADKIYKELSPEILVEKVSSLNEGTERAKVMADAGDTVLLSPGCSSFDQFRDYQHRGDRFKDLIQVKV